MANTNAPFGFRPIRRLDGAAWSSNHTTRKMQNTAGACNRGDIVKTLTDGTVAVSTVGAGALNCGVFVGCHYLTAALGYPIWTNYWPGAGAVGLVDAFIMDDPNLVFEVMADTGPITITEIGTNSDFKVNASTTGFSKWALTQPGAAGLASSDTLPFKVIGVGNGGVNISDGYDAASANNIAEVCWQVQFLKTAALNV